MLLSQAGWAAAQLPEVRLDSVFPAGGQLGTSFDVRLRGSEIDGADRLWFSQPGITAEQKMDPASEFRPDPRPRAGEFTITIADDVAPGLYEVRAFGRNGLSNPRTFAVSTSPEVSFDANGNSREKPFLVTTPVAVNGWFRNENRDYLAFAARAGENLMVQVWAERLDSRADPSLAIYGPNGQRLARVLDNVTRDPAVRFVAPQDGTYQVEINDVVYQGGEDYFYRVTLDSQPYLEAIFPPVAHAGELQTFTIYGQNLPQSQLLLNATGLGTLEQLRYSWKPEFVDQREIVSELPPVILQRPSAAVLRGANLRIPGAAGLSNPLFVSQTELPIVIERDNNDTIETAQQVNIPCEYVGQFYPQQDRDWVEFQAKKGQTLALEVFSNRLGTAADPVLAVYRKTVNADGKVQRAQVASVDDEKRPNTREFRTFDTTAADVSYELNVDQDGTYAVSLHDLYESSRGDPRFVYRLSMSERRPDFQLVAYPLPARQNDDKILQPSGLWLLPGGTAALQVRLLPRHGFAQPVQIVVHGLPAGVYAAPLVLSEKMPEGTLVLSARADAAASVAAVELVGTTLIMPGSAPDSRDGRVTVSSDGNQGATRLTRVVRPGTLTWGTGNVDQTPPEARLARGFTVAVARHDVAPLSIKVGTATVSDVIAPVATSLGARIELPVRLERRNGFAGEIELTPIGVPQGFKVEGGKFAGAEGVVKVAITDQNISPGFYTIPWTAKVKAPRVRDPQAIPLAEKEAAHVQTLLEERTKSVEAATAALEIAHKTLAAAETLWQLATGDLASKTQQLANQLNAEKEGVVALQQALENAAQDAANVDLRNRITQSEEQLQALAANRALFVAEVDLAREAVATQLQGVEQAKAEAGAAEQARNSRQQQQAQAQEEKAQADKRLEEAKKNNEPKDVEFWAFAAPIYLDVRATPIEVVLPAAEISLPQGGTAEIAIAVRRMFQFADQITLKLYLPQNPPGVTAGVAVLGQGQARAALPVTAVSDAAVGEYRAEVEAIAKWNGLTLVQKQPLTLKILTAAGN